MERREKWASYYASNSAALAHYHLALSKGGANNTIGGGVSEPYARPASPPAPPGENSGGVAGVGSAVVAPIAVATRVGNSTSAVQTISISTIAGVGGGGAKNNSAGKKKSRWSSVVGDNNSNGKSSAAAGSWDAGSNASATVAAAAVVDKNSSSNSDNSLYLNKFVHEGKSSSSSSNGIHKLEDAAYVSRKHGVANSTTPAARLSKSSPAREKGRGAGTKRKLSREEYDSSLSANESYYGPSPSKSSSSHVGLQQKSASFGATEGEDDYVPLALNQPLGTKNKKKQKKTAKRASSSSSLGKNAMSGFDSNQSRLSERAHRFQGKGGILSAVASTAKSAAENVEKYMGKTTIGGSNKQLDERDYEEMTVKGTCRTLEKEYLRLTSPPREELVRPQAILQRHLENLKRSYYELGKVHNGRNREYDWYCSQFKALRQDLTVQRIQNAFAVDVYETHAKVALEEDDINEYNQSQTQLKELYDLIDNGGSALGRGRNSSSGGKQQQSKGKQRREREENRREALKHRNEFIAYRIIYYVFLSGNRKYEGGSSDIFKIMLQLTPEQRKDECIHHALLVRAAVADNDYHKFFQLQDAAPNMSDYLMDKIVPTVRQGALQRICKAYRPSVSADFVLKELGFDVENKEEAAGGRAWMEGCGCRFDGDLLMTKDSILKESVVGVKNSLI